jgi:hypothetical protein
MQELKTKRQVTHEAKSESELSMYRRQYESPFAIGLSLWMYHNLRSQKAIHLLSKCVQAYHTAELLMSAVR